MVTFWWERKPETEIPEKISTGRISEFVHAQLLYPLSALLITSARAMSTKTLRPVENALYKQFPNLDIQYSMHFNSNIQYMNML
jgi:hypothetical protein